MNTVKAAILLAVLTVLAGCGGMRGVPTDGVARTCHSDESLVCKNGTASRLENRSDDGRFCTCERRIDGYY